MSVYGPLAPWYDALTGDVPYEKIAQYCKEQFLAHGKPVHTVLDLACGTGTLSALLAVNGYEMISVDRSPDMLAEAADKFSRLPENCTRPLLLCQDLAALDLYGTADAAVCTLDSLNYLSQDELVSFFERLRYFLEPEGLLLFDVNPPEYFRELDGQVFVDEQEDVLCVWRASLDAGGEALRYEMDVFRRSGALWARESEEHVEYLHPPDRLRGLLERYGWQNVRQRGDGPLSERGRIYFTAENGWYRS